MLAGATGEDREGGAEEWGGEIYPEVLERAGNEGGRERTDWIHRCAADFSREHGLEADDGADRNSGGDAFFFCAGGDVQDHEHEQKGEDEFEDERLGGGTGGKSAAESGVGTEEKLEGETGKQAAGGLAEGVRENLREGETPGQPKAERDGGVQVRAGNVADGVNHREDDEAEGQGDADVGDRAAADVVDDDGAGAGEDQGEGAQEFGDELLSEPKHIRQSACKLRLAVIYVKAYMNRRETIRHVFCRAGG
jgi:hypothetical protein